MMAFSPIEEKYLNMLSMAQFPEAIDEPMVEEEPSLDGMQIAAGPTATRTDAPQGYGEIRAIEPTKFEKALQSAGMTLEQAGRFLDGLGQVDVPVLGPVSLADFVPFVGSAKQRYGVMAEPDWQGTPKMLQAPAEGKPLVTGKGQTLQLSDDAKLAAFDALPLAQGVKTGAKLLKKGAQKLAPAAGEMIEQYLTKTGAILKVAPDGPGIEVPSAPKLNTPAFKNWFGSSKVVDDKGQPLVVYHGTFGDIRQFSKNASQASEQSSTGAFFFSPDAKFASSFADGRNGNVVPVYLKAVNPFDYDNAAQRKQVIQKTIELHGKKRPDGKLALFNEKGEPTLLDAEVMEEMMLAKSNANWGLIELPEIQHAIKSLGFDAFYIKEQGVKNIGIYSPTQIKSVFNKGTFDPKDPRILYGGGAAGAASQDKEKK